MAWCKKNKIEAISIRHIFPRAYIVAKPAPSCIVVAMPWQDAEKQVRDSRYSSYNTVHTFEDNLNAGDWCSVAYVARNGMQAQVAVSLTRMVKGG